MTTCVWMMIGRTEVEKATGPPISLGARVVACVFLTHHLKLTYIEASIMLISRKGNFITHPRHSGNS